MQNTPSIEYTETNVSTNRKFSVFSLQFHKKFSQITYTLIALKVNKKRWQNLKKRKNASFKKIKFRKKLYNVSLYLWLMMRR